MEPVEDRVIVTAQARQLFAEIKSRLDQQLLLAKLEKMKYEPEKQGKALLDVKRLSCGR